MADIGFFSLVTAFVVVIYGLIAGVIGHYR